MNPGGPHLTLTLPSHPMGAERGSAFVALRRDKQQADANCRMDVQPSAAGSGVQCANFFEEFSPHFKKTFRDESRELLEHFGVEFDPRYVFKSPGE